MTPPVSFDQTNTALRAAGAFTSNSLVRLAQTFPDSPVGGLASIARAQGYSAAATAIQTGRIDALVDAVGAGTIKTLAGQVEGQFSPRLGAANTIGALFAAAASADPPPAGGVLLALGGFAFMVGALAHQSIKRTHDYRWALQDRLLRTPARQFVGPGDEHLDLDGYLLPHYTGGADALEALRHAAAVGEPQDLLDSFGVVYGRYVIEHVEQTGTELDVRGQPRKIDFSIALAAYGEDQSGLIATAAASTPAPAGSTP